MVDIKDDWSKLQRMNSSKPVSRRGRPPKVPREHGETLELLLRCGMEILTEQGFAATGIDTVLKRVQVPKGSFYHYFESKEAFGQAVLERYADYFARKLDRCFSDLSVPPLRRLSNFVEEAKLGMTRYQFRRGCLVGNLGQEVLVLPDSFREQLELTLKDWEQRLSICLEEAVELGELSSKHDCRALAAFFWVGWEGAILRARLVQHVRPLDIFFQGFLAGITK